MLILSVPSLKKSYSGNRVTEFSTNCNYKCAICYHLISSCVFSFGLMKIIYLILSNCTLHGARGSNPCYCHEEGENNNNNNKSREGKVIIILRSIEFYSSRNTKQRSCLSKLYTFAEPISVFVFKLFQLWKLKSTWYVHLKMDQALHKAEYSSILFAVVNSKGTCEMLHLRLPEGIKSRTNPEKEHCVDHEYVVTVLVFSIPFVKPIKTKRGFQTYQLFLFIHL